MVKPFQLRNIYFLLLLIILPFVCLGQVTFDDDITVGKALRMPSQILGEERRIWIYTPNGYDQTTTRYPVLYLLDGETHFQHAVSTVQFLSRNARIPQMIVVALPNVNRNRDFTPTAIEALPNSGGCVNFIRFMKEELFPYVENNFRTQPYRILAGHSLGGMFSVYLLFSNSEMFQAHLAMSPYLMYDNNYVLNQAVETLTKPMAFNNFLYMTIGAESNYFETLGKFTDLLENKKPQGLLWHFQKMTAEDHGTIPLKSLYDGLETLYQGWQISPEIADLGFTAIQDHYRKLSAKFNYEIQIPEYVLNNLGYRFMGQNKAELAIEIFRQNVELYPNSANVYDSLGEGFENAGKFDSAEENYKIAIRKGQDNKDPNLPVYKQHLDRISEKKSNK